MHREIPAVGEQVSIACVFDGDQLGEVVYDWEQLEYVVRITTGKVSVDRRFFTEMEAIDHLDGILRGFDGFKGGLW